MVEAGGSPVTIRPTLRLAPLLAAALLASAAGAAAPEWNAVAGVEEVEVLTTDQDASPRETTIWMVVLEGQGYIRTSRSTTWGDNVERDPDIALRIGAEEFPLRAVFVEDEELRERIVQGFREKYGWFDGLLNVIRGKNPRIMRLDPRG
jgi:hypothetical protein